MVIAVACSGNNLEGGLFFFLLAIGMGFTFFPFQRVLGHSAGFLRIFALAIFIMLSVFMASGMSVGFSSSVQNTVTGDTWNGVDCLFNGGMTTYWVSWIFFAFAILDFYMLVRTYIGYEDTKKEERRTGPS